jgi:hypothetical protein
MATSSAFTLAASHGSHQHRHHEFKGREINDLQKWRRGILTLAYLLSYYIFSNLHEIRMDIGCFHDLAYCNSLNCSA